jgi:archaellum biogenesis ATPase FlaH
VKFFNPYDDESQSHYDYEAISGKRLVNVIILSSVTRSLKDMKRNERNVTISAPIGINNTSDSGNVVRLVIDSLTRLLMVSMERTLEQFVIDLAYLLKNFHAPAVLILTTSSLDHQSLVISLGSVVDGLIETRIKEDTNGVVIRSIRVRHIKGAYYDPQ